MDDEDYEWLNQYNWFTSNGYPQTKIIVNKKRKNISMHRMIMNPNDDEVVDHINCIKTDNQKSNLRICTNAENSRNLPLNKNNKSGTSGLWWDKKGKRWVVAIGSVYLGRYKDKSEAIKVRQNAEIQYFGEFRNTTIDTSREVNDRNLELEKQKIHLLPSDAVRGVTITQQRSRWRAEIHYQKVRHYLGHFKTKEEAIKARKDAEIELNVPEKFRC